MHYYSFAGFLYVKMPGINTEDMQEKVLSREITEEEKQHYFLIENMI